MNTKNNKILTLENEERNNDEIDLKLFINSILRRKYFVLSFSAIVTLISIFYSSRLKQVYQGDFEIYIKKDSENRSQVSTNSTNLMNLIKRGGETDFKTQEFILKSPSVLKPIHDFVNSEFNSYYNNITFDNWIRKHLEISFIQDTSVLQVKYKDEDKKRIKIILDKIEEKYRDFSTKDTKEEILRKIEYLKEQKEIYSKKATESKKLLNSFTIQNGLKDIDGFLLSNDFNNPEISSLDEVSRDDSLRYNKQFKLLETYESRYLDLSSKLKPNSTTLENLKIRINNLKSALKRPNEILIKFGELKNKAIRENALVFQIQRELLLTELEKAKQPMPWERISEPIVDELKIFPNIKLITVRSFIISIILASLAAIYLDKRTGIVYEFSELKNLLELDYIGSIYPAQKEININFIESIFTKELNNNGTQLSSCCILKSFNKENLNGIDNIKNIKLINFKEFFNNDKLQKYEKLLFIVETRTITNKEIMYLNQYNSIYQEKMIGWLFIDDKY